MVGLPFRRPFGDRPVFCGHLGPFLVGHRTVIRADQYGAVSLLGEALHGGARKFEALPGFSVENGNAVVPADP